MPQIYQTYGRLFDVEPETTNLTSDNFIGFSDGAYTNGQTATIRLGLLMILKLDYQLVKVLC